LIARFQTPAASWPGHRAWAVSVTLHAAGIAGALAFAGHALSATSWAASASVPIESSLGAERQVPLLPALAPQRPQVVAEFTPPQSVLVEANALPAPQPDVLPDDAPDDETMDQVQPLPAAAPEPDWLAKVVRTAPATTLVPTPENAPDAAAHAAAYVQPSPLASANEPPDYPFVAWRRGVEGTVTVLLEIDATGAVTAAHVEISSGNSTLDDAALQRLGTWKFAPATRGGRAVRGSWRQVVVFRLR
jgi:periplasmic protein TonB